MAGVPRLTVDVETSAPNANLAVAVFDIGEDNRATLDPPPGPSDSRRAARTRSTLYGNDWQIVPGHRIGVLISTAHAEWWLGAVPTNQTVSVTKATLELPFLRYTRPDHISGKGAVRLENYLANTPIQLSDETIESGTVSSFPLPPKMVARPADDNAKGNGKKRRRLRARLSKGKSGKRLFVHVRAPKGSRVKIRLLRRGRAGRAQAHQEDQAASLGQCTSAYRRPAATAPSSGRARATAKMRRRTKVLRVRRAGALSRGR